MKAIVYDQHGGPEVLRGVELEKPVPAEDQVLLRVRAASLNPLDWRLMRGAPFPFSVLMDMGEPRPRRIGRDVAGVVESAGGTVTRWKAGDEVFGVCRGAAAEYAVAPAAKLARKPAGVSFEEAAAIPIAGITALQGLRDRCKLQAGQAVLINGAAGGIGTYAVQMAKAMGAEVTGVCSTRNVEMVRSLGADRAIDYTQEDFAQGGRVYDAVLDNVGNRPASDYQRILKRKGVCAIAGAPKEMTGVMARFGGALLLSLFSSRRFAPFMAVIKSEDLARIAEMMVAGTVKSVIDRTYALSETAEAVRYLETGHARAKVVINVG